MSSETVPELTLSAETLMDKTTVLYGPSKSGKTVIVKNILRELQGKIDQVLVLSPTEPSNKSYEGFVPDVMIHSSMRKDGGDPRKKENGAAKAENWLRDIYERQEMLAEVYKQSCNVQVLQKLYQKAAKGLLAAKDKDAYETAIKQMVVSREKAMAAIGRRGYPEGLRVAKESEVDDKFKELLVTFYKQVLGRHGGRLFKQRLTDEEKLCLRYVELNPRLLLIFDDCAAELKPFFVKELFRKLFYQNRHSYITVVISCQDDTDLPANLRKNAFVSIFTNPKTCASNFNRGSNNFSKEEKGRVERIAGHVFQGHRKLAYIREDAKGHHFYHLTCDFPTPHLFGSPAFKELCSRLHSKEMTMDKKNRYYKSFCGV